MANSQCPNDPWWAYSPEPCECVTRRVIWFRHWAHFAFPKSVLQPPESFKKSHRQCKHIYGRLLSVCPSVCPSVCLSVCAMSDHKSRIKGHSKLKVDRKEAGGICRGGGWGNMSWTLIIEVWHWMTYFVLMCYSHSISPPLWLYLHIPAQLHHHIIIFICSK